MRGKCCATVVQVLPVEDKKEASCIWDSLLEKRMLAPCTPNMLHTAELNVH